MRATDGVRATIRNLSVMVVAALTGLPMLATSQSAPSGWVTAGLGIGTRGSTGVQLAGWLGDGRKALGVLTSQEGASKHRRYATGVIFGFHPTLGRNTVMLGGGWGYVGGCDGCGGGFIGSPGTGVPDHGGPIFVAQWIAAARAGIGASVVGVPGASSQLTWALTFRFGGPR